MVFVRITLMLREGTREIVETAAVWSCAEVKIIGIVGIEHGIDDTF